MASQSLRRCLVVHESGFHQERAVAVRLGIFIHVLGGSSTLIGFRLAWFSSI